MATPTATSPRRVLSAQGCPGPPSRRLSHMRGPRTWSCREDPRGAGGRRVGRIGTRMTFGRRIGNMNDLAAVALAAPSPRHKVQTRRWLPQKLLPQRPGSHANDRFARGPLVRPPRLGERRRPLMNGAAAWHAAFLVGQPHDARHRWLPRMSRVVTETGGRS